MSEQLPIDAEKPVSDYGQHVDPHAVAEDFTDTTDTTEVMDATEADPEKHKYSVLTNPYERMDYVHLSDELITRLDGTEGEPPDYVMYLDKSGRPVNWMVGELWDTLAAKDADGNIPKRPQTLFANIDGREPTSADAKPRNSPESIANLRAVFSVDTPAEGQEMMNAPTHLDGKRVLIVDEIQVSGDTLRKAKEYLSAAFPTAEFNTYAWMDATPPRPDAMPENNVRWYERSNDRYRAVLDEVDPERAKMLKASDPRIERGWDWLAKTPSKLSDDAANLLFDIKAIGEDIRTGRLPYVPAYERPDYEDRVEQFNRISDNELQKFVQWAKQSYWPNYSHASALTDESGPLAPELAANFGWDEARLKAQRRGGKPPSRNEYTATLVRGKEAEQAAEHAKKIGFLGRSALNN